MNIWWLVAAYALGAFSVLFMLGAALQWGLENELKRIKED
jgi:hypothetical protein